MISRLPYVISQHCVSQYCVYKCVFVIVFVFVFVFVFVSVFVFVFVFVFSAGLHFKLQTMCDSIIITTKSQHYSFEGTLKLVFELSQLRTDCVGVCLSNQKSQDFFSFFESFSLSEEFNTVATGWLSWVLSTGTLSILLVRFSISKC